MKPEPMWEEKATRGKGRGEGGGFPRGLLVLLAVGEAFYLYLALRFPLPRLYATLPPVDYAKLTGYSLGGVALLLGMYAVLVAGVAKAVRAGMRTGEGSWPRWRGVVFGGAVLFGGTLLFTYPFFAIDMLFYAVHTRLWLLYGANPLLVPVANFPQDPWIALKGEWINSTSGYSPLWEVVALVPGILAGSRRFLLHLMGLKVIALLAYLADALLIAAIVRHLRSREVGWRVLYFAWNPLVLMELVANGHNDGLMLTFLLLAVLLLVRERELAAHGALALSVLIKVTPAFLWPVFWLWGVARRPTWRERALYTLAVGAIVLVTLGVFAAFLWPDPTAWQVFHESDVSSRAPQTLAILIAMALHVEGAYDRAQGAFRVFFAVAYAGVFAWVWRQVRGRSHTQAVEHLLHAWLAVLVLLIVLFSSNWRPWYATWIIALAALSPSQVWVWSSLAFSFTASTGDVFWTNVKWRFREYLPPLYAHLIGVPYVFGIPAAVAWRLGHRRARA